MGTLDQKLQYLNETKNQIKQAIINKGQNIQDNDSFRSYVEKIQNISTGIDTSDATAIADNILLDKTAYVNDKKITGTMPNNGDVTITPTTSVQNKTAGFYNSINIKAVTASIDTNIKAENIKSGISILGVAGTLQTGIDTSDATASADQLPEGVTAYVKGQKITGTAINLPQFAPMFEIQISKQSSDIVGTIDYTVTMPRYMGNNSKIQTTVSLNKAQIATAIGLTADKIKAGETILGIEGTYNGPTV